MSTKLYDVIIIGAGIGGIVAAKYAKDAGLEALVLEKATGAGGIWRHLPTWQDIQFRKYDWTLGDVPIESEKQASIVKNAEAWIEHFSLSACFRFETEVLSTESSGGGWQVRTTQQTYRSRFLIVATGGHNLPSVPEIGRRSSTVTELHSSALRDPRQLREKRVVVVGGGASAFDLLDLCFEHGAATVGWVYRTLKWFQPTKKLKYDATQLRSFAKQQLLGATREKTNRFLNDFLRTRYKKFGLEEIVPSDDFDISKQQLLPGRRRMIEEFKRIERSPGEISSIDGQTIHLASGAAFDADIILWGTGYTLDLRFLGLNGLSSFHRLSDLAGRVGALCKSLDYPNLFFLAPNVLETTTSTPWAYAHLAKSIMRQIGGARVFDDEVVVGNVNHIELAKFLALRDRRSYLPGFWYLRYLAHAFFLEQSHPLPLP